MKIELGDGASWRGQSCLPRRDSSPRSETGPWEKAAQDGAKKGSGRLNACTTMLSKPLICRGGAGGFACVIPISQPFSAPSQGRIE
jgi:hypothetical protein